MYHALFAYSHLVESADALACAAAIVGLMSDSFCVNPDQPADSDTDGPQLEVAAFTPHPAARSRSRSALSEGFCCSAMPSRSLSRQVGVWTVNVSVSCTVPRSTGADTPICWNSRSFSTWTAVRARKSDTSAAPRATCACRTSMRDARPTS